jgi:hypothetical protein
MSGLNKLMLNSSSGGERASMELSYDSRYSIYSTVLVQSTTKIQNDDDDAQNASNVYVNNDDCFVFVAL